jgi:hypothetical protein
MMFLPDCSMRGVKVSGGGLFFLQAMSILFITFTANPKWPEIIEAIFDTSPPVTSSDRADIIARMFKLKLD